MPYIPRPYDEEEESEEVDIPEYLLQNVPGLRAQMEIFRKPASVLASILAAQPGWPADMSENAIRVGGDPLFIQNPHEPCCSTCQQPMRFLLQFPDITADSLLGDCGSGYVYGCDAHPEHCVGFVDCY